MYVSVCAHEWMSENVCKYEDACVECKIVCDYVTEFVWMYMFVWMSVQVYVWTYVNVCLCEYDLYMRLCVCEHEEVCITMFVSLYNVSVSACVSERESMWAHVCVFVFIWVCKYVYVYEYMSVWTCSCEHVWEYILA